MVTAVATPALAAATRAFAREPRACKTLIAADFGSKTRGSARAPATRAALGARAGARAATHVLRARVAGGTEWNDEANGEENDDEETEQRETRRAANDDIQSSDSEVGFENENPSALGGSFSSHEKDVHDDAPNSERRDAATNDENWLDDEQYGCSPGQLWVNAIACIGATQNPKHAFHASEFLEKTIRRRSVSPEVSPNVYENDAIYRVREGFPDENGGLFHTVRHLFDPEYVLNAWRENSDARAAELRFVIEHPTLFCFASVALCFLCFSVSRRRAKTKALKASLLNDGVDLTNVFGDHLETLEYLHVMRDKNALALGIETCAARKVETETRYLGVAALRDWREFYGSRGIDLATKDDVKKVKAYVDNLHHLEGCLLGKGRGEKSKPLGEEW
jgi:hypothetical protein